MNGIWNTVKRSLGLAEICHRFHLNPLYIFLLTVIFVMSIGLPLFLGYLKIPVLFSVFIRDVGLILLILSFLIYFHRDPERDTVTNKNAILSPADGEIVYIKKINGGEVPVSIKGKSIIKLDQLTKCGDFLESNGYLIGIGMKLFDVHINRSPIDGVVTMSKHNPGKFISMTKGEFEIMNESQTTILKHNSGYSIGIIQIATFLVRGIESYLNEGDSIKQGERIGRIKLGSQVDVVIPFTGIDLKIKPGERVYAGETLLAEIT